MKEKIPMKAIGTVAHVAIHYGKMSIIVLIAEEKLNGSNKKESITNVEN